MKVNRGRTAKHVLSYVALSVTALVFILPIAFTFLTSLKQPIDALAIPPVWSFRPQWGNYITAWMSQDFARSLFNTVFVGSASVLLSIVLAIPAAYSLARYRLRGRDGIEMWFLITRMLPEMLFILPLYVIFRITGLFDTFIGLVLVFQIYNLPYCIWMLRQFIQEIPREIDEAGRLDGCDDLQIILRLLLPLVRPGLVATGILMFIVIWTNLLFPLSLTYDHAQMISISIANFKGYGSFNWPAMAAGSMIAMIPQGIVFGFIQKYMVKGLTIGAIKE